MGEETGRRPVIICAAGRSGSTLLQGILNTIPNSCVRGENLGMVVQLFFAYRALIGSRRLVGDEPSTPRHPFFGAELMSTERFVRTCSELIVDQLSLPVGTRLFGFKEIRWPDGDLERSGVLHPYLAFLELVMPRVKFVFLKRDLDEIVGSQWWRQKDPDMAKASIRAFYQQMSTAPVDMMEIDYSSLIRRDMSEIERLFAFLDEICDQKAVNDVLDVKHSY